jgi:putative ABC transport system substrate-binding protein
VFVIALLTMIGCSQREEPKQVAERASPATQPSRITRVGMLYFGDGAFGINAFRQRLSELGYIDGKTVLIEARSADGDMQRLTQLARDFAASKVDVIVTTGSAATKAARQSTSTMIERVGT